MTSNPQVDQSETGGHYPELDGGMRAGCERIDSPGKLLHSYTSDLVSGEFHSHSWQYWGRGDTDLWTFGCRRGRRGFSIYLVRLHTPLSSKPGIRHPQLSALHILAQVMLVGILPSSKHWRRALPFQSFMA